MRRIAGAIALLTAIAAGTPGAAADPEGSRPSIAFHDGLVTITIDPDNRVNWTPDRMARAAPVTFSPEDRTATPQAPGPLTLDRLRTGPTPVVLPGSSPAAAAPLAQYLAGGGAIDYERFAVPDPSAPEVAMHGKLYMQLYDFSEAACSATVIPSASGMVVFTAGHCLVSPTTGVPIRDGAFVPGYLGNGENPFAFWPIYEMTVTEQWYESAQPGGRDADARYDIAAFTVGQYPYIAGTLADTVGYRGIAFNLEQGWAYQSFGYPGAKPFDGEKMISCISAPATIDATKKAPPFPNGMGCDMTGGSSGGGWVIDDGEGGTYVNSVVSYSKGKLAPEMQFGPYFGEVGLELFESVAGLDYPDVPEPEEQQFTTGVTLRLRKHLKASGRVSSPEGACRVGTPVAIARVEGGKAKVVAQTLTRADGTYTVKLKDKSGRYIAAALERYADSFTRCGYSETKKTGHKH